MTKRKNKTETDEGQSLYVSSDSIHIPRASDTAMPSAGPTPQETASETEEVEERVFLQKVADLRAEELLRGVDLTDAEWKAGEITNRLKHGEQIARLKAKVLEAITPEEPEGGS